MDASMIIKRRETLYLCILLLFIRQSLQDKVYKLKVDDKHPVCEVDDKFLSMSIGTFQARQRFKAIDFSSQKLKNLISALKPAYLRIGGSDANFLIFRAGPRVIQPTNPSTTSIVYTTTQSTPTTTATQPPTTSEAPTTKTPSTTVEKTTVTSTTKEPTTEQTTPSTTPHVVTTPGSQHTIGSTMAVPVTPAATLPGTTPSPLQLPNINVAGTNAPQVSPAYDQSDSKDYQTKENDRKKVNEGTEESDSKGDNEDTTIQSEYGKNGKYHVEDLKDSIETSDTDDNYWKEYYNPTAGASVIDENAPSETAPTNNAIYQDSTADTRYKSYSPNEELPPNPDHNEGLAESLQDTNSTRQEISYIGTDAPTDDKQSSSEDPARNNNAPESIISNYEDSTNTASVNESSSTENNMQPQSTIEPFDNSINQQSDPLDRNVVNDDQTWNNTRRHSITVDKYRTHREKFQFWLLANDFDRFANFVEETGLRMIFDVNAFFRRPDGSWDAINAIDLLNHVKEKHYHITWELGHEPNRYSKYGKQRTINPFQVAQDAIRFRSLLMRDKRYGEKLVGPGVTRPGFGKSETYLEDFLKSGTWAVDAVTWHQYYVSKRAKIRDFTDPKILDSFEKQIKKMNRIVAKTKTNKPVWLGETGSAWGGGAPGLSDSFVASFMFLDKLGLASLYCNQVVIRQSLLGGSYALLDEDFTPRPDFWVALLHKKLVGKKVLASSGGDKFVRIYAHCTRAKARYPQGAITIIAINLRKKTKANIKLEGTLKHQVIDQYLATSSNGKLTSKNVDLNGEELQLTSGLYVPKLRPVLVKKQITLPPHSYGFYVVPMASFRSCM